MARVRKEVYGYAMDLWPCYIGTIITLASKQSTVYNTIDTCTKPVKQRYENLYYPGD
jgi:hypothetical protein